MMPLRSAVPWWTASLLSLALGACATNTAGRKGGADLQIPNQPGAPSVLTLMPDSDTAREAFRGLVQEMGEDVNFSFRIVEKNTSPEDVARWVRSTRPKAVVLMNNPSLRVFRRYQASATGQGRSLPAVGVLTSFLRESGRGMSLAGVIYEVPLLTSVVNLRALVEQPVRKVGVIHRGIFKRFLDEQGRLAASEGIQIVPIEVDDPNPRTVRSGLEKLREEMKVDAIWVLNDNRLLSRDLVRDAWLPALRSNSTPIIVNVRSLVSADVDFGTFAVLPDHFALGTQAGQLLAAMADRGWRLPSSNGFEYPIAVRKVLHVGFARDNLALAERELQSVDELVE